MRILFCLLVTMCFGIVHAQSIQISGHVVNKKDKPIENVNVYLVGGFDGALSDQQGYFSFVVQDSIVEGILKLTHPEFGSIDIPIKTRENYTNRLVLEKSQNQLGEIVILALAKNKRAQAERLAFSAMDVVSTAGSPGNIMGVLNTLPGAQVNSEDGRLLIRGGKADESGIYVNGTKVFQPYTASAGNMPVRAKFNPFLFKGMSFSAGGYSAEFGEALSGILQLDTSDDIDPSRKDITISTVGASIGQTHQWGKNSLSYNLNYLNLGAYTALVKQRYTTQKPFSTSSGEIAYKHQVKDGGYKLYAAIDFSEMAYEQDRKPSNQVDTLSFTSNNVYINSVYFKKLSPYLRLDVGTGLGYATYKGDKNDQQLRRENWDVNQKIKLAYQWSNTWQTVGGIEAQFSQLNLIKAVPNIREKFNLNETNLALFLENQWNITTALTWRMGMRVNKYTAISKWAVQPRTMVSYQVDTKQQVSVSYGIFNQALNLEQTVFSKQQDWMQANHYIFNYTYNIKNRMLRAEIFYKEYKKLLLTPINQPSEYSQLGEGYAKGFDLFWKDNTSLKNFKYWVTYTYLDTKRKEMYWNEWIQPSYVAKHSVSLVTKYWIDSWKSQVSMTYNYNSPRLFYNANPTVKQAFKSSSIHNISASWAYLLSPQKILYASVDNLLGRNPVQAYQFDQNSGQPDQIQAAAKRFIYIGFMWTISANKKVNQLENI